MHGVRGECALKLRPCRMRSASRGALARAAASAVSGRAAAAAAAVVFTVHYSRRCCPAAGAAAAAVQAGILQGQVEGLMVIEQWQASLMRALAQLQLAEDPSARARVEASYDLGEGNEAAEQLEGQGLDGGPEQQLQQQAAGRRGEGGAGSKPSSSRSLRLRQRQQQQLKSRGRRRSM